MDINNDQSLNQIMLTKRIRCDYDLLQQRKMKNDKQIVLLQMDNLSLTGKSIIYENQEIIAYEVVSIFKNRKIINIMVVSKTQSGKTGSMCATIKQYLEDSSNLIPFENIYIITGLSSCEWKDQTKERIPESLKDRIFHRCELPTTFIDDIKDKKNILIIMDEIQVAAKKGQTIYKTFYNAGLLNKQYLYENDIKILEYTATPDGTIFDLMKWNESSSKILANVGDNYVSSYDLLLMGRVKQYKELCGYNKSTGEIDPQVFINIQEIKDDIDNFQLYLFHIIRTRNGIEQDITIDNFKQIFNEEDFNFLKYDRESEIEDINKTLINSPIKHTFIFIKEMLRCSKTLVKTNTGIYYERFSKNPDDTTINQGLIGRNTGYDNNGISIVYTNIESIEKYEKLWISNFEDLTINWHSKTTKYNDGILSGQNTFNTLLDNDDNSLQSDETDEIREPVIKKFKTQLEAKEYYNNELKEKMKGRGPNLVKPNDNGFYEATIRSNKKIYSCNEVKCERRQGLTENNYRFYPCYEDINNKDTLQFWMLHY